MIPSTTIHLAQASLHPKTNPTSVTFYNIQVENGAGLFFQHLLAQARTGPGPTPLTTPNGIQIQSAIFPQITHQTHRQIDRNIHTQTVRWARQQVSKNTMYTRYTDRKQRANNEEVHYC